jgi:hypothetical protein
MGAHGRRTGIRQKIDQNIGGPQAEGIEVCLRNQFIAFLAGRYAYRFDRLDTEGLDNCFHDIRL